MIWYAFDDRFSSSYLEELSVDLVMAVQDLQVDFDLVVLNGYF